MKNLIKFTVFAAIVFAATNCFCMAGMETKNLKGQAAPSFSLKNLNDETVNSADFFGTKPTLLFFWTTWCPHCRSEIKRLNSVAASLEPKGIRVITIDLGESKSSVSSYIEEHKYSLTVLLDKDQTSADSYGIVGVPTFFLVDKQGKVVQKSNFLPEDYEKILLSN